MYYKSKKIKNGGQLLANQCCF
jgi:hypothetical protein